MQKPTEKPLKVNCTLWRQWAGLAALESIGPNKGYLLQYTKVLYVYQVERTSQCSNQLHGFYNRFFSRLSSATLSFPPRSTTGISFYNFDSILSKFSHLNLWKHQYMPTVSLGQHSTSEVHASRTEQPLRKCWLWACSTRKIFVTIAALGHG